MTATNFNEFKKLFKRIPEDRLPYVHFIPLRTGTKVPIGKWKGKVHLSYYDVKNLMGYGGNIAIAGVPKGLLFLDLDTEGGKLKADEGIIKQIPSTFTVKTRSGGLHFYFLNDGLVDNQKFTILSKEESIKHDDLIYVEIGELRTNWQYVVCPGSWVEPNTYKVLYDVPIVEFTGEITKYFRMGNVKDLTPNRPPPTTGKVGKPISEDMKKKIEHSKLNQSSEKEKRKKEILNMLKDRGL